MPSVSLYFPVLLFRWEFTVHQRRSTRADTSRWAQSANLSPSPRTLIWHSNANQMLTVIEKVFFILQWAFFKVLEKQNREAVLLISRSSFDSPLFVPWKKLNRQAEQRRHSFWASLYVNGPNNKTAPSALSSARDNDLYLRVRDGLLSCDDPPLSLFFVQFKAFLSFRGGKFISIARIAFAMKANFQVHERKRGEEEKTKRIFFHKNVLVMKNRYKNKKRCHLRQKFSSSTHEKFSHLQALMKFPHDYPYSPPSIRFITKVWHPNVYENGDLCISILHPPVDDPQSGELPCERWNPTQNVRTILLSVISLLNEPNTFSPANVDASVMYRRWRDSNGRDNEYPNIIRWLANNFVPD